MKRVEEDRKTLFFPHVRSCISPRWASSFEICAWSRLISWSDPSPNKASPLWVKLVKSDDLSN